MRVLVRKRSGDYCAWLCSAPGKWGCGPTPDAAIGSLVRSWPADFNVEVDESPLRLLKSLPREEFEALMKANDTPERRAEIEAALAKGRADADAYLAVANALPGHYR